MTQQIVERWSQIRGLDYFHAMLELRFLGDILASNKKTSTAIEASNTQLSPILSQIAVSENAYQTKMDTPAY